MLKPAFLMLVCLFLPLHCFGQVARDKSTAAPSLPVVDKNACPFEGCSFRKWVVLTGSTIFSSWHEGRNPVAKLKKGDVVTGLTGVHITYEPDRIRVLKSIPELHLQPGDIVLQYMYHGEGCWDIWSNGEWKKEYGCSFITEENAKVISEGKKAWWVQLKTAEGSIGWIEVKNQFDCMDSLGGDANCESLNTSPLRSAH